MRRDIIEYFLRRSGRFYYGDPDKFEEDVAEHYPWIIRYADELMAVINKRLEHDAKFRSTDASAA